MQPRAERVVVTKPIKAQLAGTGRILAGLTRNLSTSGALLGFEAPAGLLPGQRLHVGIPELANQAILIRSELRPARVVRVDEKGGVAVAFED